MPPNHALQRKAAGRRDCTQNNISTARLRGLSLRLVAAVAELGSLARYVRSLALYAVLVFTVCGCTQHESERPALDRLLSSNSIDRIVVVYEGQDSMKTNVLSGERVARLLSRLNASNRVAKTLWHKSYVSADIYLYDHEQCLGSFGFFPQEQLLSFRGYTFSLRDTNDVPSWFR